MQLNFSHTIVGRIALGVLTLCLAPASSAQSSDPPLELRASVERAVGIVKPALVRIHVVSTSYAEGREVKFESSGSGVIITAEGHIITNHHVAGHAARLLCTFSNREEIEAELIGTDALSDIAVIKLKGPPGAVYPVVEFSDSSLVRVGDDVLAMGSPLALSQSVTLGIVSNTEMTMPRRMGFGAMRMDGEDVGSLVRWIAHDAQIFGGNSGGPLINLEGKIIGINEISMGLGGAIPGNLARAVAEELIERGSVRRAWLGVTVQPRLKSDARNRGLLVSGVFPDSAAEEAGFESGDLLVRLAGEEINVRFSEELPLFNAMTAALPIGEAVSAIVLRGDEEVELEITPAEREKAQPKQRELKQWGLTVRDLSFVTSRQMKRDNQKGVLVMTIRRGGPAGEAKPAIGRRDVITEVGGKPVENVEALVAVTAELTKGKTKPTPTLITIERGAEKLLTVAEIGVKKLRNPGREAKKAWLPVATQVVSRSIARQLGTPDLKGFRVTETYEEYETPLEVGDLIVAVDGEPLRAASPEDYEELETIIRAYSAGTEATLSIIRGEGPEDVKVELARAPRLPREMKKFRDEKFEFTSRNLTFSDRAAHRWKPDQAGAIVEEMTNGGWAALGAMGINDLIIEVSGQSVANVAEFEEAMEAVAETRPTAVVFRVLRGVQTVYLEIEPNWGE